MPRVVAISVCLNDEPVLPVFLEHFVRIRYPDLEFVLVDNGSSDGSVELVRAAVPRAHVVRMSRNAGTTGGYNAGCRVASELGASYVMFLALDVVLDPDAVWHLADAMGADPSIGVIAPIVHSSINPPIVESMGWRKTKAWRFASCYQPADGAVPPLVDADYVDGGVSFYRREALDRVGLLDEQLFIYAEDVDICFRLRRCGYRVCAISKAKALHRHAELHPRLRPYEVFYGTRNLTHVVRRYGTRRERAAYYLRRLCETPAIVPYYLLRRRGLKLAAIWFEALYCGLTGRVGKSKYVV